MSSFFKHCLSVRGLFLQLVFSLAAASGVLAADIYSTNIPSATVRGLQNAAADYRSRGVRRTLELQLPTREGLLHASVVPHDIRSPDYKAEITTSQGRVADATKVELFRGAGTEETAERFVRLSVVHDTGTGKQFLYGFYKRNRTFYKLVPTPESTEDYSIRTMTDEEAAQITARCGVSAERLTAGSSARSTVPLTAAATSLRQAEIATEADYEFVRSLNGQASANAAILSIMNAVDAVYRSQLGLAVMVTYQHAWATSNQPYSGSSSDALLDQFTDYWNANFRSSAHYDTAHLWTARNMDGNVVGLAYVGTVCSNYNYGISQYMANSAEDVPLAAHEIAHNFNAVHDSCRASDTWVMCPVLVPNANQFSPASKSDVSAYCSGIGCLSPYDDDDGGGDDGGDGGGGGGGGGGGTPANNAPVLNSIGSKSVTEGQTLTFTVSGSDPDGDALTYTAAPLPSGAAFIGRTFTYTPPMNAVPSGGSTTTSVTFSLADGRGLSDSETVVITIFNVNEAPRFVSPGSQFVDEGQTLSLQLTAIDDGTVLAFRALDPLPPGATLTPGGVLAWRPAGDQSGEYLIDVSVNDNYGASDSGTLRIVVSDKGGVAALPLRHAFGDVDGDGSAEGEIFRRTTAQWYSADVQGTPGSFAVEQFGLAGDIPLYGDFNGDLITDRTVFRTSNNTWYTFNSGTGAGTQVVFGTTGDLPLPGGDYDGDGRDDQAVFRPAVSLFVYKPSSGSASEISLSLGQRGDLPVPCDYNGDGVTDAAVYRPGTGEFRLLVNGREQTVQRGQAQDIAVPADYNGDGRCEIKLFRPATGEWLDETGGALQFGLGGDIPVPLDYNGDGAADIAVFRPREALWYVKLSGGGTAVYQLGLGSDAIAARETYYYAARNTNTTGLAARSTEAGNALIYRLPAQMMYLVGVQGVAAGGIAAVSGSYVLRSDYDGDGQLDLAVFTAGWWTLYTTAAGLQVRLWGQAGDVPVSGDFDGDGFSDIAVFRPDNGDGYAAWYIVKSRDNSLALYRWGLPGDQPLPADYNGDGVTDPAVWRPANGVWFVLDGRSGWYLEQLQWGLSGDYPRAADFDGDGSADKIVWRPASGTWFVNYSTGRSSDAVWWGLPGDVPLPGTYISSDRLDFAVWRPSTATLFIRGQNGQTKSNKTALLATDQAVGMRPGVPLR